MSFLSFQKENCIFGYCLAHLSSNCRLNSDILRLVYDGSQIEWPPVRRLCLHFLSVCVDVTHHLHYCAVSLACGQYHSQTDPPVPQVVRSYSATSVSCDQFSVEMSSPAKKCLRFFKKHYHSKKLLLGS